MFGIWTLWQSVWTRSLEIPIGFVQKGCYRVHFPQHKAHFLQERVMKASQKHENPVKKQRTCIFTYFFSLNLNIYLPQMVKKFKTIEKNDPICCMKYENKSSIYVPMWPINE